MPAEKQCADECAICLEPMKYPAALHCGHAMDSTCLMKVLTQSARSSGKRKAPCPICRKPFDVQGILRGCRPTSSSSRPAQELVSAVSDFEAALGVYRKERYQHLRRLAPLACLALLAVLCLSFTVGFVVNSILTRGDSHRVASLFDQLSGSPAPVAYSLNVKQCEAWHAVSPQDLPSACAIEWLREVSISRSAGRPQHAVAHARKALLAARPGDTLRPHVLLTLARALEAAAAEVKARTTRSDDGTSGGEEVGRERSFAVPVAASEATEAPESTPESLELLSMAATEGHSRAMVELAYRIESRSPVEAASWYVRGAGNAGDGGFSWRRLGVLRLTGVSAADGEADYAGAALAFERAAEDGDADGAFNLGRMYEMRQVKGPAKMAEAVSTKRDDESEEAAAGDPITDAVARKEEGESSAEAADAAELAYATAAANGAAAAAAKSRAHSVRAVSPEEATALVRSEWRDTALHWYEVAASRGLVVAHAHLARLLLERGRKEDAEAACRHYTAAAEAHDADSMWELVHLLRNGLGCLRDAPAAAQWLAAAAEHGHPGAMTEVGAGSHAAEEDVWRGLGLRA